MHSSLCLKFSCPFTSSFPTITGLSYQCSTYPSSSSCPPAGSSVRGIPATLHATIPLANHSVSSTITVTNGNTDPGPSGQHGHYQA